MKKYLLFALLSLLFIGAADAATIYYSPTCPYCHDAIAFFESQKIDTQKINVTEGDNINLFRDALIKCKLSSGGVPVIVIGDRCWQGYSEMMNDELRTAANGDDTASTPSQKKTNNGIYFYGILAALVAGLGFILLRKKK